MMWMKPFCWQTGSCPLNPDGTLADPSHGQHPRAPATVRQMNHHEGFQETPRRGHHEVPHGCGHRGPGRRLPHPAGRHAHPRRAHSGQADAQKGPASKTAIWNSPRSTKSTRRPKGPLTVVEDFDLKLKKGEFISLIGHSGCGKSTALTMAAGLNQKSPKGGIILDGREVVDGGPRARRGLSGALALPMAHRQGKRRRRRRPGLSAKPPSKSGRTWWNTTSNGSALQMPWTNPQLGLVQRHETARRHRSRFRTLPKTAPARRTVRNARQPDPLGACRKCSWRSGRRTKVTAICVTHDVDEAILLADRVVMMTNGPQATIGKITEVDLPRPRTRKALLGAPRLLHLPPGSAGFP